VEEMPYKRIQVMTDALQKSCNALKEFQFKFFMSLL